LSDPASLKNLYDIVTPGPVPWWPPAPGWYVFFAIIIIVTAWLGFRRYRDWKANQYRMSALGRLAGIEKELDKEMASLIKGGTKNE